MANLTKAEIQNVTVSYNNPTYMTFDVNVNNDGAVPKISVDNIRASSMFYEDYGSLQCAHHLAYSDNTTVDIPRNYGVSNAAAVIKTDKIEELTNRKMTLDYGVLDRDTNFSAYNFWEKLTDTTNNYRFGSSIYQGVYTSRPFRENLDFIYLYKGNTNDNVNWFRADPYTAGVYFAPNEGWQRPSNVMGWLVVKGMVGENAVIVGTVRPYIYVNTHTNHLKVQYQLNANHPTFDFDNGEYTTNPLVAMMNATPADAWWEYGHPIFTMVLVKAP